jgi:hypothetical protein
MFPYHWNKIRGLIIAYHRGKLGQRVPIKKVARYLWWF